MDIWPQFRSPLIWDVFAGLDLLNSIAGLLVCRLGPRFWRACATAPKTASPKSSTAYWHSVGAAQPSTGNATKWASLLLAGLSTPLVLSVHSVVSFDFAVGLIPGWHTTIFPPYFVAGAIYAGFAMVLTLMIPMRLIYGLDDFITERHLNNMAKVMLASGLIVGYGYFMEQLIAWVQCQCL